MSKECVLFMICAAFAGFGVGGAIVGWLMNLQIKDLRLYNASLDRTLALMQEVHRREWRAVGLGTGYEHQAEYLAVVWDELERRDD